MKKIILISLILMMSLSLISCENDIESGNKEALKLTRMGNYTEALNLLNDLLLKDNENDTTWNNISLCYDAIGEYNLALDAAKRAVALGDENEAEYSNLGNAYFDLNEIEKARDAYERSLELNEDYFYALYGMGIYHCRVDEYDQGIEYFINLYNNNPMNINVVRYIAFCEYKRGNIHKAIEFLEEEINKINDEQLLQLLDILYEIKKNKE